MKKYVVMSLMALVLAAPQFAMAQSAPVGGGSSGGTPPVGGQGGPGGGGQFESRHEEKFEEHKAEILQRMNEHLGEIQKRISCVQAAKNHEELRSCLPEHPPGMGGGGGQHGGWGQSQGGNGSPPQGAPPQGGGMPGSGGGQ